MSAQLGVFYERLSSVLEDTSCPISRIYGKRQKPNSGYEGILLVVKNREDLVPHGHAMLNSIATMQAKTRTTTTPSGTLTCSLHRAASVQRLHTYGRRPHLHADANTAMWARPCVDHRPTNRGRLTTTQVARALAAPVPPDSGSFLCARLKAVSFA